MITLFKSITEIDAIEHISVDELFNRLDNHKRFSPRIRDLAMNDPEAYKASKKSLPCFCIGKFKQRKENGLLEYSSMMGFDIDQLANPTIYKLVLSKVKQLEYIFAVFPSVSNKGLRILVNTNSIKEQHKRTYEAIIMKLTADLKDVLMGDAHIDVSTKDLARGWFYEYLAEGELFINQNAKTFIGPSNFNKEPIVTKLEKKLCELTKLNMCNALIQVRNLKGRNDKVMQLTRLSSEYGVTQNAILSFCYSFIDNSLENSFTKEEIDYTVTKNLASVTKSTSLLIGQFVKKFGKIALDEIKNKNELISPKELKSICAKSTSSSNKFKEILNFILDNYNLRFNDISKELDISETFESEKVEVNIQDITCKLFSYGLTGFHQILNAIVGSNDYVQKYNPLIEYLNHLPKWSPEKKDHISELADYITTDDDVFFNIQFKKMLVRNLACSLGRMDFNKQVFTLVGMKQNLGKTTFLRNLIPEKLSMYYKEEINLHDKDSYKSLATDLFIILDEVHMFNSKDLNKLKSWISTKMVKLRLPYRKDDMTAKRIANFFATSNDENFLTDNQNVRWLIFKVKDIKHDHGGQNGYDQNINIDNVYAQALYLLNSKDFEYKMTLSELKHMEERNSKLFSHQTLEEDLILKHFEIIDPNNIDAQRKKEYFKTSTEVYEKLMQMESYMRFTPKKVGAALTKLRFHRGSQRINGNPRRGYYLKVKEINDYVLHDGV